MTLINKENAIIEVDKFLLYCLNEEHPVGKHKARLFKTILNISSENYQILINEIKKQILIQPAYLSKEISFGNLYFVDFEMKNLSKIATVRTTWIVRNEENFPRLTSCYIIK